MIARFAPFAIALAIAAPALAQNPNVLVKLDARLTYQLHGEIDGRFHSYDPLGRHSVVQLAFALEPGFDVVVSERFERIQGDADHEQLEEYYIEDKDYWRFGKQFIPFGRTTIVRESAYGARVDTTFGAGATPIALAYLASSGERQRGFVARAGKTFGVSVAIGRRLAQSATSLCVLRHPELSRGLGSGYGRLFGADGALKAGKFGALEFEHVSFRQAETSDDRALDLTDVAYVYKVDDRRNASIGVTHEWRSGTSLIRATGSYPIYEGVAIEPFVRSKNGRLYDAAITIRIKP